MTRKPPNDSAASTLGLILVVEDDPRLRLLVAEFLRGEGFPVDVAGTGSEALRLIEWERPGLVLLHFHLPDMSGAQVMSALKRRGLAVPVVLMTAAHDAREWAEELEAVSYIPKPVNLPLLRHRLNDLLA